MHYITFRASAALLTALALMLIVGPRFIAKTAQRFGCKPRPFLGHNIKENVPTIGGVLVLGVVWVTLLLWGNLTNPVLWLMLIITTLFGSIGFLDDWRKLFGKRDGILAGSKLLLQLLAATVVVLLWLWLMHPDTRVWVPFFKNIHPDIGLLFIVWAIFIIIGASNAVNLTDGLDGLATSAYLPTILTFSVICYIAGHSKLAAYLAIPFAPSAELAVAGGALGGAMFGFLWFNTYPAQMFLGDIGSLSLGAGLALMALMCKQELLLPIAGALFVIEVLSVLIQVASYKMSGKRVFKMAPLHHHYELLGWPETKITVRFGIICMISCLLALMMLKIR
jgi:phospho-N-acetylmuramoyl-pentapeptide-transferase